MKNYYIAIFTIFTIFNPFKLLFSQNEFKTFDSNGNIVEYTTNTPRDLAVICWDHLTAGNIPLWVAGLRNAPIPTSELIADSAVNAMKRAAIIWEALHTGFLFNKDAPSGANSIQIVFDNTPSDFKGNMNTEAITVVDADENYATNGGIFKVTNSYIIFNACADRYNILINPNNPWKWTADYIHDFDLTPWVDFESVCLHELGHVLGLEHSDPSSNVCGENVVMQENMASYTLPRVILQQCDITGINYMRDMTFEGPVNYPNSILQTDPQISFMRNTNNNGALK